MYGVRCTVYGAEYGVRCRVQGGEEDAHEVRACYSQDSSQDSEHTVLARTGLWLRAGGQRRNMVPR